MKKINLVVCNKLIYVSISFDDLKQIDDYTRIYDNSQMLLKGINEIFNLNIDEMDSCKVFIEYIYIGKSGNEVRKVLPVRYSLNNYNFDSLRDTYAKYYKDNHKRIMTTVDGIKHMNYLPIKDYINGICDISDKDIDFAVNSYLDGSYKRCRDAYFTLVNGGYKVHSDRVNSGIVCSNRSDLNNYVAVDEEGSYLKTIADMEESYHDKIMDELSDNIEKTKKRFNNNGVSLFDGNSMITFSISDEALYFEFVTGKRVDKIQELLTVYHLNNTKKRIRNLNGSRR